MSADGYTLKAEIGCLACRIDGNYGNPADLHHPTQNGRRLGLNIVIPLCPWHHRGQGMGRGPSLAKNKRKFHDYYGTDEELLAEAKRLLAEYNARTVK